MKQKVRRFLSYVHRSLAIVGIDPVKTIKFIGGLKFFYRDFRALNRQKKSSARVFPFGKLYPCLDDRFSSGGSASGHYFHQDLLVARRIFSNKPVIHVDVGSRVDGFVAHVASFRTIFVFDIRPLPNLIPNVNFIQADFMMSIGDHLVGYCDSLSCLHAMEHFGLGRYGDPINYDGYLLGLDNAYRVLKPGGKFYFSTPIGPQRIEFNAHRVFSVAYLLELFSEKYHIDQFSFVDDHGDLHEDIPLEEPDIVSNFGCSYGCGIFEMTKR